MWEKRSVTTVTTFNKCEILEQQSSDRAGTHRGLIYIIRKKTYFYTKTNSLFKHLLITCPQTLKLYN